MASRSIPGRFALLTLLPLLAAGGAPAQAPPGGPDDPEALARRILDDAAPREARERLAKENADRAVALVRAMTADLPDDAKEEYRRIPWVWRVSIAAGRAGKDDVLRGLLDVSLPREGERLRDWQAVVLGGGVINGVSLEGKWPGRRLKELIGDDADLAARWGRALRQAAAMADDEKVPTGTRYDALRMIALDDPGRAIPRLRKYLPKGTHAELQMGAVSGLSDVESPEVAPLLAEGLAHFPPRNRTLALEALLRTEERAKALLDALEKGAVPASALDDAHRAALRGLKDADLRRRAERVLGKP